MIWTTNFLVVLVLTSLTGSVFLFLWFLLGLVLDRLGFRNILYTFLKILTIFFVVPVVYLFFLTMDGGDAIYRGVLFLQTPQTVTAMAFCVPLWICLAFIMFIRCVVLWIRLQINLRGCFVCDKMQRDCFREICEELGIKEKRVRLRFSYRTEVPFLIGTFRPMVVLPVGKYDGSALRTIFHHELTHYLHRDLWLKDAAMLILIIHCWNPVVWWYNIIVRRWCEYACDYDVCMRMGGMKDYFQIILNCVEGNNRMKGFLSTQLFEDKHELLRRVKRMERYRNIKVRTKVQMGLASILLVAASTVSVYAASTEAAEGYVKLYEATEVEAEESLMEGKELIEYVETEVNPAIVEELGETQGNLARSAVSFDWTVPTDYIKKTSLFSAKSGGSISVTAYIDPIDKVVKVGIIEPDGTRRYAKGSDTVFHTFALDESGYYRVYIENETGTTVYASGSYNVR